MTGTTELIRKSPHSRARSASRRVVLITAALTLVVRVDSACAVEQTHSLSPSYHATVIHSEADDTYTFHSPGISYNIFVGRTFGFRGRASIFFPARLFENGRFFHAREYYSVALGGEGFLGAAYQVKLPSKERVIVDIGADLHGLKLGSDVYESFYSFTFGFGAAVEYFYPISRLWTVGTFVGIAGHYLDFIHDTNGLKFGVYVTAGITVGLQPPGRKGAKR